jgi:RHS repeat-associated protein
MSTTVGKKDIATTGSSHGCVTPPEMSLNPPTPPAGPVPVPYPYTARSATAKGTVRALEAGGSPVLVKGSHMNVDMPANQPAKPTGGDVVTHAVCGSATTTSGASSTKAGGAPVCATEDTVRMNLLMPEQGVAQATVPLLLAGGADFAGGAGGDGASAAEMTKRALIAQAAKRCEKGHPVDVATGFVIDEAVDITLPGAIALVWKRTYCSVAAGEKTSLGKGGWAHGFDSWVEQGEHAIVFRDAEGRDISFDGATADVGAFNRAERLTLTADRHGGYTIQDHATRLVSTFAPLGLKGRAMLRALSDPYGHSISLEYEAGNLARVLDTSGREVRVQNDTKGRVTRLEVWAPFPSEAGDARARRALELWVDYAYSPDGELASATNALGHADRFEYDGFHRMVKTTLKNGTSFYYLYDDETGWCVKTWGDDGLHTVVLNPDLKKRTTTTSGTHEPRRYTWNGKGLVVREETFGGSFVCETVYDADSHVLSVENGVGEKASFEYDARGNRTKAVDPAGNETTWEYADDLPVKRTGPDKLVTAYQHDGHGALVGVTFPSGLAYSLAQDPHGRLAAIHGADGTLAGFTYDGQHNLVEEVSARGARTQYEYEPLGRPRLRTDALGRRTQVEYDRLRQPVGMRLPDGTATRAEYETLGNIARFTDALGQTTAMEYAGTGVLARMVQADGQVWRFRYDEDERLKRILNPRAEEYDFVYDAAGRVEREKTFDGRILEYRWSKAGRLSRIDYPDQSFRELLYDALGNLIEDHAPDGDIVFERDALGRLGKSVLSEYGGKVVNAFERDRLGRVVAEKQNDRTIRYAYDDRGRRAERIMPGGETTRYFYDILGALSAVDHDGHKLSIERDVLGRETRKHVYQGQVDIQSAYDAMDRLAEQRVVAPAPAGGGAHTVLSQRRWSYDGNGRVRQIDDARSGTAQYQYDSIGQLIEAKRGGLHEVFEYDVTGSLQNVLGDLGQVGRLRPWDMHPGNVLTATPEARYENDLRGRRTKKATKPPGSGSGQGPRVGEEVTDYSWDTRDRLREVKLPDGRRVRFTYDAFARRVRKEVIPAERADFAGMLKLALVAGKDALPKSRVVEFLWDGDVLAGEIESGAEKKGRVFVHHPGTFVPMLQADNGAVFTYVNDHLGMPKELVDQDGRVAWAGTHSAWGRVVETWRDPRAKRGVETPFRLLGQYADDETGLCYTRFRYFDAGAGRWCSPDPIGISGGRNLLAFDGAPTWVVDPWGLACEPERHITEGLYAATDREDRGFRVTGSLREGGILELDFRLRRMDEHGNETSRSMNLSGSVELQAILQHFGGRITAIEGNWQRGDNLAKFNSLRKAGKSPDEAALGTWTGTRAQAAGFGRPVVEPLNGPPGAHPFVKVLFHEG